MAGFIPPVVVGIGRAVMGTVSKNPVKTARILAVPAKAQLRSQAQKTGRIFCWAGDETIKRPGQSSNGK